MPGTRRASLLVALICLSSSRAFADDPYADYRIPDHHWLSWTASVNGSGSHQRGQGVFGLANNGGFSGQGGSGFSAGYDSDAHQLRYNLVLSLSGSRGYASQQQLQPPSTLDQLRRDRNSTENVSGSMFAGVFPWRAPLGFSASLTPALSLNQSWSSTSGSVSTPPRLSRNASSFVVGRYSAQVNLAVGAGFGRVRDATPIYQAQLLERRLRETGVLSGELSAAARERLASLYTLESSVAFAHERPTKYFWRELERLLREDGALGDGGLDAYSVQRLLEPLAFVGSAARPRGFSVGPQVVLSTQRFHSSQGSEVSQAFYQDDTLVASFDTRSPRRRANDRSDFVFTGFAAEFHRPVGMRWQTDAFTRALLSESGERLNVATGASVSWFIADRWYATTSVGHSAFAPGHGTERRVSSWSFVYAASVDYFLEDAWSLRLATELRQSHDSAYSRSESYFIGISRRLAGLLTAPGLFEPMRLTPPTD